MNLQTRLTRAEKRVLPGNPVETLTDDELDLALSIVRQAIAEKADASPDLDATTSIEMDAPWMRAFVADVKREAAEARKQGSLS